MTLYKARLGWSMTSLKTLRVGTNAYVHVCHIKIFARWQHDKMVSISAATVEDKCFKMTVACQEFKMGCFPRTLSFLSSLKNRHILTVLFLVTGIRNNVLGKNFIQHGSSKNSLAPTSNLRIILLLSCLVDP